MSTQRTDQTTRQPATPVYCLENLTVRHLSEGHAAVLHGISLSIAAGEQLAIIGPSGAGKTTLLALLACAHKPDTGRFTAFGSAPWDMLEAQRHRLRGKLFLAPQAPPLPPRQRVITAVLAARLPHWSLWQSLVSLIKPSDPEAAYQALSRFGLGDKLYSRVDRLSGGERQRCALARLLLSDAEVLLVDEPLSALDPALSQLTIATLQQEAAARSATLVCSLHQVDIALASFARIVGLRDGHIAFDLPRADVTDAMITALYQNEARDEMQDKLRKEAQAEQQPPSRRAVGACL
jgi:phosphonate transport system ATP-binding protein